MRNVRLYYPKDRNTDIKAGYTTHNSYWNISHHKVTGWNTLAWSQISKMRTSSGSLCTVLFCFLCVLSNLMRKCWWYPTSIIYCCQATAANLRPSFPRRKLSKFPHSGKLGSTFKVTHKNIHCFLFHEVSYFIWTWSLVKLCTSQLLQKKSFN